MLRRDASQPYVPAGPGRTDTGDPAVLIDFLSWGIRRYPARRYFVVIWNHGEGWDDTPMYETVTTGWRGT